MENEKTSTSSETGVAAAATAATRVAAADDDLDDNDNDNDDSYRTENDYYYTYGHQPGPYQYMENNWLLKIDYKLDKQKKKTAKSNERKFNTSDDIPNIFGSFTQATLYEQQFRDHVERVCRGNKKRLRKDIPVQTRYNMSDFQDQKRKKTESAMLRKKKKEEDELKKKADKEEKEKENREEWQQWRNSSCQILEKHIKSSTTYKLLLNAPNDPKSLSTHVLEHTMKKSICLRQFLFAMKQRDDNDLIDGSDESGRKAADIATTVGEMNLVSQRTVYQYYKEWRDGEQFRKEEVEDRIKIQNISDTTGLYESIYGFGSFQNDMRGSYRRQFLLEEEDIKIDFKRYIRKTIRTVTVLKVQHYLNTELLPQLDESERVLKSFGLSLPISADTAWRWMHKCNAGRISNDKTYFNDHHNHPEVILYRNNLFRELLLLFRRMRVWYLATSKEQQLYMAGRELSEAKAMLPIGELVSIEGEEFTVHHMDDKDGWEEQPSLHPSFTPCMKPVLGEWGCDIHSYEECKCHLELREYGQDESIFRTGETSSRRWALDGRSYAIKKGMGTSRMASVFKDYSEHGVGLNFSIEELESINVWRVGKFYKTEINGKKRQWNR